ncbi:MAG: hypothetical protein IT168_25740 [Bryobacterales bacterium]|nr:hypothetical protein [Bryobacterales bacterium]
MTTIVVPFPCVLLTEISPPIQLDGLLELDKADPQQENGCQREFARLG